MSFTSAGNGVPPNPLAGYLRGHFALLQREKQRRKGRKERENIKREGKRDGRKTPLIPRDKFLVTVVVRYVHRTQDQGQGHVAGIRGTRQNVTSDMVPR